MTRRIASSLLGLSLALCLPHLALAAPAGISPEASADTTITVYRFWNGATGTHFYTASEAERDHVVATWPAIFRLEGRAYEIDTTTGRATQPLYRFYNRRTGTHFYTATDGERDDVITRFGYLFSYEGPAYNVIPSTQGTDTPVYRFHNLTKPGVHFYTASGSERDRVITKLGWAYRYEGIAFFVSSVPQESRTPVICIDPGHQAHANLTPEPIGPGSTQTKPMVAGGTTGINTRLPEHQFALAVSMKIKERLEARGVRVVMTRVTSDVDISNSQRAQVANAADADLFLRIHADGSTNTAAHGISTLYPSGNAWVVPIEASSLRAAQLTHASVVGATGASDRGVVGRSDMAGFNWSVVPSIIVECGFMTNPTEDQLLASEHYQDHLADGITDGVMAYLGK